VLGRVAARDVRRGTPLDWDLVAGSGGADDNGKKPGA
jgi:hypothetical protein